MKELIRHILREEVSSSAAEKLLKIRDSIGLDKAMNAVGGLKNFIKIVYGGDIKEFLKDNNILPYLITPELNLFIADEIVQLLDLPDTNEPFFKEKDLGYFTWTSGGIEHSFHAYLKSREVMGSKEWLVVGKSGNRGFGYHYISKSNILGPRVKKQIYKQIIDRYNLDSYK